MYQTFTQEKTEMINPHHYYAVLMNIPSHKHSLKYYPHGCFKKKNLIQHKATQSAWGHTSAIPEIRRQWQVNHWEFKTGLVYRQVPGESELTTW